MYRADAAPDRNLLVLCLLGRVIGKDRFTGATLWEHDLGARSHVSLAVVHDRVFATNGAIVFTIEYPSGRLLHRRPLRGVHTRSTLLVDGHQVFVGVGGELTCFDWNGQELWHDSLPGRGVSVMALGFPHNVVQADNG